MPERNSGAESEPIGAPQVWREVCRRLQAVIGAEEHSKWIADLRFIAEIEGAVVVAARDPFCFSRVNRDFKSFIVRAWKTQDPKNRPIQIACWKTLPEPIRGLVDNPWSDAPRHSADLDADCAPASGAAAQMTFDTLVTGDSNRSAVACLKRIAAGDPVAAPIQFMSGRQGVGKTHMLRALMNEAAARGDTRKITYMHAEEFLSAYVAGAIARDTQELKQAIRTSDLVLIDDLQAIKGKEKTEKEFFANIRSVTANGGQVILTADEAPGELDGLWSRLRGALKGAASVQIDLPDEAMREEILRRHARLILETDPNFRLDDAMVARILREVRGPGRDLCGVLWSLQIESEFGALPITTDMIDRVIRRNQGERKDPSIDMIKRAASASFNVTKANLESASKARVYCYPRQIAMYLCRTLTDKSFPQIGKSFGDRDHTTVLHAFRKIEKAMASDACIARDISRVEEAVYDLQAGASR